MNGTGGKAREIGLGEDFGDVVVKANGAQVRISADGALHGIPAAANDATAKAVTHEIRLRQGSGGQVGAVESTGEHKGEIYGGIWSKEYGGDNKPIWFSAAPGLMNHYNAAA